MLKMPVIKSTTNTKVKMFILSNPENAEEKLQEWLQTKHDISIDHIVQSQSERNGRFLFIVSIFYRTNRD
jgi:serine protease inhibitor